MGVKVVTPKKQQGAEKPADVTAGILEMLRQLQPEQQNEIIKDVLREVAIDRSNRLTVARADLARAETDLNNLVIYSGNFEKMLCEAVEKLQTKPR